MSTDIYNLAVFQAKAQNVDLDIVLATIDAETGFRNILGDSGNAMTPGQVWPKWHNDDFVYMAGLYHLNWPSDLYSQQQIALNKDQFATAVAVRVIGKVWVASGKNWDTFTHSYVGQGISQSDYDRRYQIWLQYQSGNPGTPTYALPDTTDQTGINNQIDFPATNYGIVANSQKYGNILYGRRYRVIVTNPSRIGLDVSDLRCTFNIQKIINEPTNFSTVVIYNLNPTTENFIIEEGDKVIIEAGYEGSQYGVIFEGDILQPIRDKSDNVTYRLTLYALDSRRQMNQGFVNFTVNRGQSARSMVTNLSSKANVPTQLGDISNQLSTAKLPRGKAVFGLTRDYLRQISQANDMAMYAEEGKTHLVHATDPPRGEIIDLTPSSGLIGQPAQQDFGVSFKCLLNPSIKMYSFVHIDNSLIQAQAFQIGQVPRALDEAGIYRVVSIVHDGDTRGDNWYTECVTVSQAGGIPAMIAAPSNNPW